MSSFLFKSPLHYLRKSLLARTNQLSTSYCSVVSLVNITTVLTDCDASDSFCLARRCGLLTASIRAADNSVNKKSEEEDYTAV